MKVHAREHDANHVQLYIVLLQLIEKTKSMPSDQHLYFRELELNGSSTLAECDIPPGATLFLKVRAF